MLTNRRSTNTAGNAPTGAPPDVRQSRPAKAFRVEWLGQTAAIICWILAVFAYGVSSLGDWLQLFTGTSWLVANVAAFAATKE